MATNSPQQRGARRRPHCFALLLAVAATAALAVPHVASASYGWPVKPFAKQHPVRGFFGDPRIHKGEKSVHFGIDVSAADGTRVYATLTGRVSITADHPDVVAVGTGGHTTFEYWHVVPTVSAGDWVTAYRTVVGRVAKGWGHVHFAELRDGAYVNPLRRGAMAPYRDVTRPEIRSLTVERGGVPVAGRRAVGRVDLVVEARDETPLAVPAPWTAKPVAPAQIRWRLIGSSGALSRWQTAVDFSGRLPAGPFDALYGRWTRQNHPWSRGRYRFLLSRNWDSRLLSDGRYRLEVAALDTRGNVGRGAFSVQVENSA